jgi:hypothetical protein
MKNQQGINKQRGFFDMGISLIILALGGTTAAMVTPQQDQATVAQQQHIVTTEAAPATRPISYDIDS